MYEPLRQITLVATLVVWWGGALVLGFRYWAKRGAYLRHFPPVEGVPLDMYVRGAGSLRIQEAIYSALWQSQDDPEVERLRRAVWRRIVALALWTFGGLIILAVVISPLLFTGDAP